MPTETNPPTPIQTLVHDWGEVPLLLTPKEASRLLGFTESSLAAFRASGRHGIGFVRCGRAIRYPKSEVERFLLRNFQAGRAEASRA